MLRGIRTTSDMEYEFTMSLTNQALDPELETVFLMATDTYAHLSGSLLRQIATFGGEQDFRIQFVLAFYWRELMDDAPAAYYDHDHWPAEGPEWVIFHRESFRQPVPSGRRFTDKFGNGFELIRTFPTAPLSGTHWFLYQKTTTANTRPEKSP